MKKVTLTFPDPNSLWLFKDQSKAVNVNIAPRRNLISGLFSSDEVDIAVNQFQAVQVNNTTISTIAPAIKHTETATTKPLFSFRFSRLLSLLNL